MSSNVKITSEGITCTDCGIDVSGGYIYSDTPAVSEISNIVPTTQWVSDYISSLTGIPIGGIIMWNGASAPAGWALCDGTNGTPNLSGRFVLGQSSSYGLNTTGGETNVTLTTPEIPAHSHDITDPGHSHTTQLYYRADQLYEQDNDLTAIDSLSNSQNEVQPFTNLPLESSSAATGITINQTGESGSHNNMPPYYVLAYIIRIS